MSRLQILTGNCAGGSVKTTVDGPPLNSELDTHHHIGRAELSTLSMLCRIVHSFFVDFHGSIMFGLLLMTSRGAPISVNIVQQFFVLQFVSECF